MRFSYLRHNRIHIGILALLTGVAFLPFVSNPFVALDDNYLIYENAAVQTFTFAHVWHVFTHFDPQLYIPFTFLSWQLNAALFGLTPLSFHTINVLLHGGNAVLVYVILRKWGAVDAVALFAAILFAMHPLQTEAVLWATGRKDLLSGAFALGSLLQYLRHCEGVRSALRWSIILFLCALLSKVSVVLLPVLFVAVDWIQKRPLIMSMKEKIPFFVLMVVFLAIAVLGKSTELGSSGTLLNLLLPSKSVVFYLTRVLWPRGLSVIYPYTASESLLTEFTFTVGVALALGIAALWFLYRRVSLALALPLAMFFLFLAPSFTTFWKNGFLYFASDRYAYLALIGIFWLIATGLHRVLPGKIFALAEVVLICVFLPITWMQGEVWNGSEALYRNVLRWYPQSVMAHTNLGLVLLKDGKIDSAETEFHRAIFYDQTATIPRFNVASAYEQRGDISSQTREYVAIVDVITAREINSHSDVKRFVWLVDKLQELARGQDAQRLAQRLTTLAPHIPEFQASLGQQLRTAGDDAGALTAFEKAREAGTQDARVYYYLAELYSAQGRTQNVIHSLQSGLQIDPTNEEAALLLRQLTGGS